MTRRLPCSQLSCSQLSCSQLSCGQLSCSQHCGRLAVEFTRQRALWLALAVVAWLGCSRPPRGAEAHPGEAPASTAATHASSPAPSGAAPIAGRPPLASCAHLGPLACARAPTPRSELCASSSACIAGHVTPPSHFEGLTFACDPDDAPGSTRGGFTAPQPAPPASGISAISLMNVVAQNDVGMMQLAASYLVADLPEGSCLVDRVHDWDARPGYVETQLDARWQPNGAGFRLNVQSRRLEHEPLDESESAEGVSDVRSDACQSLAYDVLGERFTRVAEHTTVGPCPAFAADAPGAR